MPERADVSRNMSDKCLTLESIFCQRRFGPAKSSGLDSLRGDQAFSPDAIYLLAVEEKFSDAARLAFFAKS